MIDNANVFVHVVVAIGRGTQVNLAGKVFGPEPGFVQRTCGAAGQVPAAQVICAPGGIALLCQQDFACGSILDCFEQLEIVLQQPQVNQVTGRGQLV